MTKTLRSRLNRLAEDRRDDRGVTLVELLVAMGIFSIVLVVFLAATGVMARSTVRNQVVSDTASQLRTAFQRFDKEVRYAHDINAPGTSNGNIYVEYWVPASATKGENLCVQWRYNKSTKELQRRTWTQGNAASVTQWITMVTRLRNDLSSSSEQPFTFQRAGTVAGKAYLHQRLHIYLDAGLGSIADDGGSQLDVSFVAQNSSPSSVTNSGVQKVCLVGTVQRP
jgi:prepilin-type N-terminal cleavage/methylation domain-containing protein